MLEAPDNDDNEFGCVIVGLWLFTQHLEIRAGLDWPILIVMRRYAARF